MIRKYPGDFQCRYSISSCPVRSLQPDPVRRERPFVAGSSVLNLKPSSTFKKIAMQPSQKSISAFFSRPKLAPHTSQTIPWDPSCSMNILLFRNRDLHGPTRRHSPSQLKVINFDRTPSKLFFYKDRIKISSESTLSNTFRLIPSIPLVNFDVMDLKAYYHSEESWIQFLLSLRSTSKRKHRPCISLITTQKFPSLMATSPF